MERIFNDCIHGKGTSVIAKELQNEGVPTIASGKWHASTVLQILRNEKYKGDALLQKTYTVDFLNKKRAGNTGQVPQYYVEKSHPAIIDKEQWEAVQLEMERRRSYCSEHGIQKMEYSMNNPFTGKVICGTCGHIFGRKVWNSTDERRRLIIWRCNDKYAVKGEKGCASKQIDEGVLYQVFVGAFNAMIENKDYFLEKWQERFKDDDLLVRYKARQFIGVMVEAEAIVEFDAGLYFMLVEKMTVFDGCRVVVSLLDGTDVECMI